jgi:hypothetical protein
MKTTSTSVALILMVILPSLPVAAQCGVRIGDWGYGPTHGADGNGEVAVFGSGRMLRVADISDPASPSLAADLPISSFIQGIAVVGDLAYVAASEGGLVIVDISQPASPRVLSRIAVDGQVIDVIASGDTAILAAGLGGLVLVDVTNPASPTELSSLMIGGDSKDLAIHGTTVFVANGSLTIVDISNPSTPELIGTYDSSLTDYQSVAVTQDGSSAYLSAYTIVPLYHGYYAFHVVDVRDPSNPIEREFISGVSGTPSDVAIEGGYAYMNGMRVYDISDPFSPVEVHRIAGLGEPRTIRIHNDFAYLTFGSGGIRLVDVADPVHAEEISSVEGFPSIHGSATHGATALFAVGEGFMTFDLSEIGALHPLSRIDSRYIASHSEAAFYGNVAFVTQPYSDLGIIDLSEPSRPVVLGTVPASETDDLAVIGHFLFAVDPTWGLLSIDVSNPTTPEIVTTVPEITGYRLAVEDHRLFTVGRGSGIRVIDVSDPGSPAEVSEIEIPSLDYAHRPAVSNGKIYVRSFSPDGGRINIIDVTDPGAFSTVGFIEDTGHRLVAVGNLVFVAGHSGETPTFNIYDAFDPANPVLLAHGNLAGSARGELSVDGPRVTVPEGDVGFEIFDLGPCFAEAPTADFSWSPHAPEPGHPTHLVDTSIGSVSSWQWDFGDGSGSTNPFPAHTWSAAGDYAVTLTVDGPFGGDSVTKSITVEPRVEGFRRITDPGINTWIVAASAHLPGAGNTHWVTDMVLHNPGTGPTTAHLWFLKSNYENIGEIGLEVAIPAQASVQLPDVVASVFDDPHATGAVLVGADAPLGVISRTFHMPSPYGDDQLGTYGQFIPARALDRAVTSDEDAELIQLTRSNAFRTNLGIANATPTPIRVDIRLLDASGIEVGTLRQSLPAFSHAQQNDIFTQYVGDGRATVSSPTEDAAYFPYASVVDNQTGDPIFVEPIDPRQDVLVAATAHAGGFEGTDWRTDLELCNPSDTAAEVEIRLLATDTNNSSPATHDVTVEPGACTRMPDVLDAAFGFEGSAALDIRSTPIGISVSSRTYTGAADGTFGQFLPGLGSEAAIPFGEEARILAMTENAVDDEGFRTNVGFVNRSPNVIRVETYLFTASGRSLGTITTRLDPHEHRQLNRILRRVTSETVENGYAIVLTSSPEGSFVAYASVVDNTSGDPIFVPAMKIVTP